MVVVMMKREWRALSLDGESRASQTLPGISPGGDLISITSASGFVPLNAYDYSN